MISIFIVCLFHLLQIQYPVAQHFRAKNHFLLNAPLCCLSLLRKTQALTYRTENSEPCIRSLFAETARVKKVINMFKKGQSKEG